jgi:hypothetical protein
MQFLDAIGLASFWEKIKNWANSNFFSKRGGEIHPKIGLQYTIDGEQLSITKSGEENETISIFNVDENRMEAIAIVKSGGTATQVLMADGSVKTLNASNGIAGLDSKGNVPLSQLGNLDTTVAEVVTALPTTNIKKHIYLIKDASGVTQNQYEEYIYTGDTSATYDASKWEKLGDFRATVDLADYAKKSETVNLSEIKVIQNVLDSTPQGQVLKQVIRFSAIKGGTRVEIALEDATSNMAGLMSIRDKNKLDRIAEGANNYSLPLAANGTRGGIQVGYTANGRNYPVQLSGEKAYVNVPWTDTNTTYGLATSKTDGLMKASDKAKIDSIDTTYTKKSENIQHVNVIPDTTSNRNGVELEFTNVDEDPIVYAYIPEVTTMSCGVMNEHDKLKLDEIDSRATADSAIPTSVIDALK